MPAINVNIQPEVIHWALSQTQESKLGDKLMKNIKHWLDGTKTPTFNQIEDFSKKSNIPLGYFFLQTPPKEYIPLLEYRTVDSIQSANPSRNLIDTIHEMEAVQDWICLLYTSILPDLSKSSLISPFASHMGITSLPRSDTIPCPGPDAHTFQFQGNALKVSVISTGTPKDIPSSQLQQYHAFS